MKRQDYPTAQFWIECNSLPNLALPQLDPPYQASSKNRNQELSETTRDPPGNYHYVRANFSLEQTAFSILILRPPNPIADAET
jgi:hypothetical protein